MKKILYNLFIISGLLIAGQSCTKDFESMNTPSNAVTEVNPAYFFTGMVQGVFANYQRNVNLYPDEYSQYWSNTVGGFGSPRYEYRNDWIGNQWNEFYTGFLRKSIAINDQVGTNPLYTNAVSLNEIWICYMWSRMTDTYGDIPYFKAGTGETALYTSQKEIYYDLFSRLDKAVKNINASDASQVNFGAYDLIYKGDVEKWKRFGNTLRLRFALRISNVDPAKGKEEAIAAIAGGLINSNTDNVVVPMWSKGWYDYLHQMAWWWDNIRISKTFTTQLYNQSSAGEDPRAPLWLAYKVDDKSLTKEQANKATYEGLINGYNATNMPSDKLSKATINLKGYVGFSGNGENAMYLPVMFYSEALFLQAEAALRGWTSGDPNSLYKEGVKASMDYVGVASDKATTYVDGLPDLSGSNEAKLKSIITQKWVANFPNGVEGWADFRRTDYPDITLPIDGVSGNASVAPNTWVKRIRYPDNQHQLNEASMPAGLNTYDTDRMDVKVWWDKAGTETKGSDGLMNSNF